MTDVEIRYDGQNITDLCVIAETHFTSRSGGTIGDAQVVVSDVNQTQFFTSGKTLELFLDGIREWDGYVIGKHFQYWFDGHTANCHPCPHITPRRIVLNGGDRNILFTRRVLFDVANPLRTDRIYAAGTNDSVIINDFVTEYLSPHDGIDYSTKVETVASPDPWQSIDLPGPSNLFGDFMRELSQSTGAVFYIDPDRFLIYSDVNTETAPFVISDRPATGEVGCREVEILRRADEMINDAMIWGAGQGSDSITFARVQDAASIAAHGRWQNTGGFRYNLFRPESVERVADSIVYGSPSSKRGHKDDVVSVVCSIFEPGLRVSDKVRFRSDVFSFEDVIPVREMTITFIDPTSVRYDLRLSHEIDEPWTTVEYWWPQRETRGPGPDCPTLNCDVPIYGSLGHPATTNEPADPAVRKSHRRHLGSFIPWHVSIEFGLNLWNWTQEFDYSNEILGTFLGDPRCEYTAQYLDKVQYTGLTSFTPIRLVEAGPRAWQWITDHTLLRTPLNEDVPGAPIRCRLQGTLTFMAKVQDRVRVDDADSGSPNLEPHTVQVLLLHPGSVGSDGLTAPKPARPIAPALLEGAMVDGESTPIDISFVLDESTYFYISPQILEPELGGKPVGMGRLTLSMALTYESLRVEGTIRRDHCQPVPICGTSCVTATQDGLDWRIPVVYIPGSLEVTMNGLPLRWGVDFTETAPQRGEFRLASDLDTNVYGTAAPFVCFDAAGMIDSAPVGEGLFVLPTHGSISGTFGAQTGTWGPYVWRGTYYEHFHNGVDFSVGVGSLVYAAAAGLVGFEDQVAGGTMIHLYHSNGMRTTYAHLSERLVASGVSVSQGEPIARSGASGTVTGPHLHWGLTYAGEVDDPLRFTDYSREGP